MNKYPLWSKFIVLIVANSILNFASLRYLRAGLDIIIQAVIGYSLFMISVAILKMESARKAYSLLLFLLPVIITILSSIFLICFCSWNEEYQICERNPFILNSVGSVVFIVMWAFSYFVSNLNKH